jgi:hypothetical protein
MTTGICSSTPAVPNSAETAPNPATDPSRAVDRSAAPSAVPSGSANNAGQRLQQILREADATIEKYAAYAGVTLRPAHGPIGRSLNANAVYNKLVADGAYDPDVAAAAQNFLTDMAGIGESAGMNCNLRTLPTAQDPKGVPLNQDNTKCDPELVKALKEMYRNEQATQRGKTTNGGGNGNSGPKSAPSTPQNTAADASNPSASGEQLWGNQSNGAEGPAKPKLVPNAGPDGKPRGEEARSWLEPTTAPGQQAEEPLW